MRGYNAALIAYNNLDLDDILEGDTVKETPSKGLLAPKKNMSDVDDKRIKSPAYRAAKHVKILRDKRESLNGDRSA